MRRMAAAENYTAWLLTRGGGYLGGRVLDLGSGIGTFAHILGDWTDVVAVEPDPGFVSLLRERFARKPNVTVVEGDAFSSEIEGTFDTIVCLNVLEHIADGRATLRRLNDLLAVGGHLLLLVPAHPFLYSQIDRSVGHERRYTRRALGERLADAGFATEELRYVNPIGAFGWLVSSKLLRRDQVPAAPLKRYDVLVPLLRRFDRLHLPFGLSVWAVARRVT